MSLSVCLSPSVREHISGTAGAIFTNVFVHISCGSDSVLLWRRCDTGAESDVYECIIFIRCVISYLDAVGSCDHKVGIEAEVYFLHYVAYLVYHTAEKLDSSNLGVISPWVRTPKMWRWATTFVKSAQAVGPFLYVVLLITVTNLYPLLMFFCVFSIYVMFLLHVYMFTICSCHVVLKVYLPT